MNNKYDMEEDAKKQSKFPLSAETNAIISLQDGFSSRNVSHVQRLKSSEKLPQLSTHATPSLCSPQQRQPKGCRKHDRVELRDHGRKAGEVKVWL